MKSSSNKNFLLTSDYEKDWYVRLGRALVEVDRADGDHAEGDDDGDAAGDGAADRAEEQEEEFDEKVDEVSRRLWSQFQQLDYDCAEKLDHF